MQPTTNSEQPTPFSFLKRKEEIVAFKGFLWTLAAVGFLTTVAGIVILGALIIHWLPH